MKLAGFPLKAPVPVRERNGAMGLRTDKPVVLQVIDGFATDEVADAQ